MASSRNKVEIIQTIFRSGFIIVGVVACLVLSSAAHGQSADADKACLGCHGAQGFDKKLPNGDILPLHIAGDVFARSVHNAIGCAGCHSDIGLDSHPPTNKDITSARDYSVAAVQVCRGCHADKFTQYESSIHAALARDGNLAAPSCADCHRPHAVIKGASESMETTPCKTCHSTIFSAYAGSVHGLARSKDGKTFAPLCAGCHSAHDVKVPSTGDSVMNACLGCHAAALTAHQSWLPNAALHFEAVSCSACHVPAADRRVDLRLFDNATQQRVAEQMGVPVFESRARSADKDGKGLDAMALWNLLNTFNREGTQGKTTLRGRLEVRNGTEAHQLADKTKAIHECRTCHSQNAEAFNSVTVSIAGPDGRPIRYGANKEVLNSVISIDSVRGFYAIGGTRIHLLDGLVVLAFLAGIGVPAAHLTLKWLVRQHLKRIELATAAVKAQAAGGVSIDRRNDGDAAKSL